MKSVYSSAVREYANKMMLERLGNDMAKIIAVKFESCIESVYKLIVDDWHEHYDPLSWAIPELDLSGVPADIFKCSTPYSFSG